jgi:phosphatidate cytidylyltransferase
MDRPLARIALAFALFALVGLILSWVGRGRDPSTSAGQAPSEADPSAWRKAPTYLLLNLVFLAVILAPARFGLFPLFLGLVGILAAAELLRAIARVRAWIPRALIALFLLTYLPGTLLALAAVRRAADGAGLAAFLYLCVAAHDAFAQILGRSWGRRPLAPCLSPGKTVEGALGGLGSAALIGAVLAPVLPAGPPQAAALGLALGVAALGGDLLASAVKRAAGLKDFGQVLGPQGGLLDRVDGLLLAALAMLGMLRAGWLP